jgi:hypothetical protein
VVDKEDDLDKLAKAMTFTKRIVEEASKKINGKSEDYKKGFSLAINFYVNITAALMTIGDDGKKGYSEGTEWISTFTTDFWGGEKKRATVPRKKPKK